MVKHTINTLTARGNLGAEIVVDSGVERPEQKLNLEPFVGEHRLFKTKEWNQMVM